MEAELALLPIDPVGPVELVLVTTAAAPNRAPWPVAAVVSRLPVLTALPRPEGVLLVERALGLELAVVAAPVELALVAAPVELAVVAAPVELAVVAAPVELAALVPEVVEPVLPVTTASAAGPGLPLALSVLVDVEGLLALPVGLLLVALAAVFVAGGLAPVGNTVLAWDV